MRWTRSRRYAIWAGPCDPVSRKHGRPLRRRGARYDRTPWWPRRRMAHPGGWARGWTHCRSSGDSRSDFRSGTHRRPRVHRTAWPFCRTHDAGRRNIVWPAPMVWLFWARVWPGPAMIVHGSVVLTMGPLVASGPSRSELAVVNHIYIALVVHIAWRPRHGGRNELPLRWRVHAIVIAAVGRTHVIQLTAAGHPRLGNPLPIVTVPVPAALDPDRIWALGCC